MISRVLVVDENKSSLNRIVRCLRNNFHVVVTSKSIEESIRMTNVEQADAVLLTLPRVAQSSADFLSVLRLTLGVSPLIGIANNEDYKNFPIFSNCGVDDIVYPDVSEADLMRKIYSLSEAKEKMCSSILLKDSLGKQKDKKVIVFSRKILKIFDDNFLDEAQVAYFDKLTKTDDYASADIYLIDSELKQVEKLCAHLKMGKSTKHKPMLLMFDEDRDKAVKIFGKNIGIADIMSTALHPSLISCKVNAHVKYKRLLDEFYRMVKKSIYLSSMDALTGVYNRSFLEDYIKSREYALNHSAVLMIDLDKFKEINDKYGHTFADKVLQGIAAAIKSHIRITDLIARYGGDEFIVFLRNTSKHEVDQISGRILKDIGKSSFRGIHCTVSIGACCIDTENVRLREAIFVADSFMYISKRGGGNSVHVCG